MKIVRKSMLALLLASCVPMTGQAAGIVSTVATASDDIVVSSNAEATVTATGRTDLIAGKYSTSFVVGYWTASVTSGTLAWRLNRAVNPPRAGASLPPIRGIAINTRDPAKKVDIYLNARSVIGSMILDGWQVAPQGGNAVTVGNINLDTGTWDLTPGSYPVGIEVASYAY